jgi:phosphoenolpyruvate synthase/pyruvate phosphate dikinase
VQLLARNLGIPNVAVDQSVIPTLQKANGRRAVMAVSVGGLVQIADDGPQWDSMLGKAQQPAASVVFEPDLKKLDLTVRNFVSLDTLRARDSGRIVGPKAAKLGELKANFPDRVAPGVGLPFGLYRATVLDRPYRNTGKTVFQWMVESFRKLEAMPEGSKQAAQFAEQLRSEIYSIIIKTDPGPQFREQLRAAMAKEFGADFRGGVFIRSDTNVEDLPGFTGAGLNLTLFNIVGFDNLVKGILEVWASPYTERAWAWRQAHMKGPEHIYPAVLLLRTVPSDISGVMITQDVDSGDRNVLSVAVNEGVGGAVEGQAAESVRIDRRSSAVRLMATATAPRRMVPQASGGIARLPTSGAETLLTSNEVRQLIAFSEEIEKRFQQHDERGQPAAADVEFAFVNGRLWLLQIRPFNESRQAQASAYLAKMDEALEKNMARMVNLREAIK